MLDLKAPRSRLYKLADKVAQESELKPPKPRLRVQISKKWTPLLWFSAGSLFASLVGLSVVGIATANSPQAFRAHIALNRPTLYDNSPVKATLAASHTTIQVNSTQIQSLLDNFVAQADGPMAVSVLDLKTGESGSIAAEKVLPSASLYKLFVAGGIYSEIDNGQLSSAKVVPGTNETVASCLKEMIVVSDNVCGEALETMLGLGSYDATLLSQGYIHTEWSVLPVETSVSDVALLYERLYNGTLLSPTSSKNFIALLKEQQLNNRLPQGLPNGTQIAHKTGDLDSYVHDAGIVYGPKTDYLIVVMAGPWSDPATAPAQIADLSRQVWALLEK
ncbi:MAG: serine hydrolase [Candidatus Saccharimonadia bacterium]